MAYVYPKLPAKHTMSLLRIAGNGLANCLFVYARAIALANKLNLPLIAPTWFNFTIGPWIRMQKDKRHYLGLMGSDGEISGVKKIWLLNKLKHVSEHDSFNPQDDIIIEVCDLEDYFTQIIPYHSIVAPYIYSHLKKNNISQVLDFNFDSCVAAHVRLGDYIPERRVPISWYKDKIESLHKDNPDLKILLFSDGKDEELSELMSLPYVNRAFFGNAIADIIAISKCSFLIGSDSTFSAWGAYLGQVPSIFYRLKSRPVLADQSKEIIEDKTIFELK